MSGYMSRFRSWVRFFTIETGRTRKNDREKKEGRRTCYAQVADLGSLEKTIGVLIAGKP